MNGRQIIYPDTGQAAWFCVCAANECSACAYGPFRSREGAQVEASLDTVDCDNAHFVTDRLGPDIVIKPAVNLEWLRRDFEPLAAVLREHNAAVAARAAVR